MDDDGYIRADAPDVASSPQDEPLASHGAGHDGKDGIDSSLDSIMKPSKVFASTEGDQGFMFEGGDNSEHWSFSDHTKTSSS